MHGAVVGDGAASPRLLLVYLAIIFFVWCMSNGSETWLGEIWGATHNVDLSPPRRNDNNDAAPLCVHKLDCRSADMLSDHRERYVPSWHTFKVSIFS